MVVTVFLFGCATTVKKNDTNQYIYIKDSVDFGQYLTDKISFSNKKDIEFFFKFFRAHMTDGWEYTIYFIESTNHLDVHYINLSSKEVLKKYVLVMKGETFRLDFEGEKIYHGDKYEEAIQTLAEHFLGSV